MDQAQLLTLAKLGAVAALGLAAVGSALGCGTAGMAAIGRHGGHRGLEEGVSQG